MNDKPKNPRQELVGEKVEPESIKPLMRAAQNGEYNDAEGEPDELSSTGDTPTQ